MLEEALVLLLPGSEQFRLQQSRAIETTGALLDDCALLQQSGMLAIEPSPSCAPAPTAPPSIAAMRAKAVSHLRIVVVTILRDFVECQACEQICLTRSGKVGGYPMLTATRSRPCPCSDELSFWVSIILGTC